MPWPCPWLRSSGLVHELEDGDLVRAAALELFLRGTDDPVDHARLRAVPRDALAADVHRQDVHDLEHRSHLRQAHAIDLRGVVAAEIKVAVGTPRAARVAHVLEAIGELLR